MNGNDARILLDLNYPGFQSDLFDLDVAEIKKIFKTFRKLRSMTWNEMFRDHGLKWEELTRTIHEPTTADADMAENTVRAPCACSTYCQVRLRALQSAPHRVSNHLDALAARDHE